MAKRSIGVHVRKRTGGRQRPATAHYTEPKGSAFMDELKATARQQAASAAGAAAAPTAPVELTARTSRLVDDLRTPFVELAEAQGGLAAKSKTLAPRFVKAFTAWKDETKGTFISFVCLLDPSVPTDRAGYRTNSSYQAADYLRRLMAAKKAKAEGADEASKPHVASPAEALAVLVASLLPLVEDAAPVWRAFEEQLHWTPARITHLQHVVAEIPSPMLTKPANERRLHLVAATPPATAVAA